VTLQRQFSIFLVVGFTAAILHYGVLIALVEVFAWGAVPASLAGYVAGGVVSYGMNRTHTYASDRPHEEAGWRFILVAAVGFGLTYAFIYLFHEIAGLQYVLAQILTTGVVLFWSFLAHKIFTFRA
jgi:putative flippase GtrA